MVRFEAVINNLDEIELINLLRKVYFKQEGMKDAMLEIVKSDKQVMFYWRNPDMLINAYARDALVALASNDTCNMLKLEKMQKLNQD